MYPAWPTYYVSVHFLHGQHAYTYATQNQSINVNDVVMVPVGENGDLKPAIVSGVHTKPPSDFPVDRIKWIVGMAGPADRALFTGIDMRVPLDISCTAKRGPKGEIIEIPTTREERIRLRQKFGNNPKTKIVEERYPTPAPTQTAPKNPPLYVSVVFQNKTYTYRTQDRSIKVNDVVVVPVGPKGELLTATVSSVSKAPLAGWSAKELDQLKWVERKTEPPPTPPTVYWTQITHLLDPDQFICSHCHYVTTNKRPPKICPQCSARMKETKYVPSWVDEAEWYDSVLGP